MAPQPEKTDLQAILQTPEAQKAIAEAVANAVAKQSGGISLSEDTRKLFSEMALAIADMSHQGSGRVRPVAPEVMGQRQEATRKLFALLAEVAGHLKRAKDSDDAELMKKWMPRYQVVAKIFFNEKFIEPYTKAPRPGDPPIPSIITWSGPPNARVLDALSDDPDYKPQNDPTAPFVNILGTVHPATPQKAGDVATLAAGAR